jgi:hypothetical protein
MDTVALSACVIVAQVVMMGVAIGLLDGVAAGLFSVISVIIAADLTRAT